jgi:dihydrodipicolinate synthase/N-acetylneuraminate lyase
VKAALHVQGVIKEHCLRLPLCRVSDSLYQRIQEEMQQL